MLSHTESQSHTVTQPSPRGTHSDTHSRGCLTSLAHTTRHARNPPGSGTGAHDPTAGPRAHPETASQGCAQAHASATVASAQRRTWVAQSHTQPRRRPRAHTQHPATPTTRLREPHGTSHSQRPFLCPQSYTRTATPTVTRSPRPHGSHTRHAQESQAHDLSYALVTRSQPRR